MSKKEPFTQARYWEVVERIIRQSDVVIELLDARFPYETINSIIEGRLKKLNKPFIRVITKSDLVDKNKVLHACQKLHAIPFSARKHINIRRLIREIMKHYNPQKKLWLKLHKEKSPEDKPYFLKVSVVGYPNVGKSALINALKGKKAAPTSSIAGFTRGQQWIRISQSILLVDTPGVIPFKEKSETKLILKSAITNVKDPESAALDIIEILPKEKIERFYQITASEDPEETLKSIAIKKNLIKKGNLPDTKRAALMLIYDIQNNKLKIKE